MQRLPAQRHRVQKVESSPKLAKVGNLARHFLKRSSMIRSSHMKLSIWLKRRGTRREAQKVRKFCMFKKLRGCQQYKWTGAPYSDQLSRGQPKQHQDPTESNCIIKENVRRILTFCIFLPYLAISCHIQQG